MDTPLDLRVSLENTLDHVRDVFNKIAPITSARGTLKFPDLHKLSEGLFLSAWSYWEEFCRELMIIELATSEKGVLVSEVKRFRTAKAAYRLAERIVNHPDHPIRFVEWHNYETLKERANSLLGDGHRFIAFGDPITSDLKKIQILRNAIAHKSDKAWQDFTKMIKSPPFSLPSKSCKGITPGRFISSHDWNTNRVLIHSITTIRGASHRLVPNPLPAAPPVILATPTI